MMSSSNSKAQNSKFVMHSLRAGFAYIKSNPSKNLYNFKGCLIKITRSLMSQFAEFAWPGLRARASSTSPTIICRVVTFIGQVFGRPCIQSVLRERGGVLTRIPNQSACIELKAFLKPSNVNVGDDTVTQQPAQWEWSNPSTWLRNPFNRSIVT